MINPTQAEEAIKQVRDAHRLSAAFYQRMILAIEDMAKKLNVEFYLWDPLNFDRPCRSTTSPKNKWIWDFLPLVTARFVYSRHHGLETNISDVFIEFEIIIDEALERDYRIEKGIKGQPDPLTMPENAGSIFRVYIHRPLETSNSSFEDAWDNSEYPNKTGIEEKMAENLKAICLEWPLSDLLSQPDNIFSTLEKHCQ